jgi:hypothetical protein
LSKVLSPIEGSNAACAVNHPILASPA